jgi:lysophospholipase
MLYVFALQMMRQNLRGEMTVALTSSISISDFTLIDKVAEAMSMSSTEELQMLKNALYPSLMCAAAKSGDVATLERLRAKVGLGLKRSVRKTSV